MKFRPIAVGACTAFLLAASTAHAQNPRAKSTGIEPCCNIAAIDFTKTVVTARDKAGKTFQFKVADAALLKTLRVGQSVTADFATGRVTVNGAQRCCAIIQDEVKPAEPVGAMKNAAAGPINSAKAQPNPAEPINTVTGQRDPAEPIAGVKSQTKPADPINGVKAEAKPSEPVNGVKRQVKPADPVNGVKSQVKPAEPVNGVKSQVKPAEPVNTAKEEVKPGEPCCNITAINTRSGVVTGRVIASGATFRFQVKDAALLRSLKVGQQVFADFTTRKVRIHGAEPCCGIIAQ